MTLPSRSLTFPGGDDPTPANPLSHNYAPLQQLFVDLTANTVADYNWISPNQFNDMHTSLKAGFMGLTGDAANIRQGDNFLSMVVPAIMASNAYLDRGAINFEPSSGDQSGSEQSVVGESRECHEGSAEPVAL